MRLVNTAASQATPSTRSSSSAWEVVSITATALPARAMAASVAWSSGAPGVVTCAEWRSRSWPTLVSTVPIRPVDRPAASNAATARNEVVVLPSVPVIPTVPSVRDGSSYHQLAEPASAAREAPTTSCGRSRPVTGCSTSAAAAPAAAAEATYSWPSTWNPGRAANRVPSRTARESSVTPRTSTSPSAAAPIGRSSRRAPRTRSAARRRAIRPSSRRGSPGSAAASSSARSGDAAGSVTSRASARSCGSRAPRRGRLRTARRGLRAPARPPSPPTSPRTTACARTGRT